MRPSRRPKQHNMTSRSRSKSPTKKTVQSVQGNVQTVPFFIKQHHPQPNRNLNKRQALLKMKKAASRLCERPEKHSVTVYKKKAGGGSLAQGAKDLECDMQSLSSIGASIDKIM